MKPQLIKIYTAIITHKHGVNFYASRTEAGLEKQIVDYAKEWWGDAALPFKDDGEPQTDGMSPREIIGDYFDAMADLGESVTYGEAILEGDEP
jgi:hypothetical protein